MRFLFHLHQKHQLCNPRTVLHAATALKNGARVRLAAAAAKHLWTYPISASCQKMKIPVAPN